MPSNADLESQLRAALERNRELVAQLADVQAQSEQGKADLELRLDRVVREKSEQRSAFLAAATEMQNEIAELRRDLDDSEEEWAYAAGMCHCVHIERDHRADVSSLRRSRDQNGIMGTIERGAPAAPKQGATGAGSAVRLPRRELVRQNSQNAVTA